MDKKTRTLNAMKNLAVDRVPVNFYTHLYNFGDKEEERIKGCIKWFKESDMDFFVEETDGYMEYPVDGDPCILDTWKRIKPLSHNDIYYTGQVERTKRILEGIDGACLFYILYTPFSTIKHTTLNETTVNDFYREDSKAVTKIMEALEDTNFELMERLSRETGLTGYFVSLQNAEKTRFSEDEYTSFLSVWDKNLISEANKYSEYTITHMCSWTGEPNRVSVWNDYDYKVVNWSVNIEENLSMEEGRKTFKPGTVLMGGFDNRPGCTLHKGTKQEIEKLTFDILDSAGQRGTILCADCSVQDDQSVDRLRAVVEASKKYSEMHSQDN